MLSFVSEFMSCRVQTRLLLAMSGRNDELDYSDKKIRISSIGSGSWGGFVAVQWLTSASRHVPHSTVARHGVPPCLAF